MSKAVIQDISKLLDIYRENDRSIKKTSEILGVSVSTVRRYLQKANEQGLLKDPVGSLAQIEKLKYEQEIRVLKSELKAAKKHQLSTHQVRQNIFKLCDTPIIPPDWVINTDDRKSIIGVPSLAIGDVHFAEVVDPAQVENLNKYNVEIATERWKRLIHNTIDVCFNHMVNPDYPGIVVNFLGDMFSGEIHDELLMTNEFASHPALLRLLEISIWGLTQLADKFGRVFVPCVPGNHGRTTKKMMAKNFAYTNYDWLYYSLMEFFLQKDDRIKFMITPGEDLEYRIYNHNYRISHGAQFRGGDSIIGPLGPVTRGDNKKRAWTSQTGQQYHTAVYGHFHRLIMLEHIICNGSLIGRNEFSHKQNFPFEEPFQALWFTHPRRGITFRVGIHVSDKKELPESEWVSWKENK